MLFIPDASVVSRMRLADEEDSELARSFMRRFRRDLFAPDLILFEVANAMQKAVAARRITVAEGWTALDELPGEVRALVPSAPLLPLAFAVATELPHPVYDCVYLALAERDDALVVTADDAFLDKLRGTSQAEFALSLRAVARL